MNEENYLTFVQDHIDEIVVKVIELENFGETDISCLKSQILHGINIRRKMPVIPFDEIKQLLVGYMAIRFIEEETGMEY